MGSSTPGYVKHLAEDRFGLFSDLGKSRSHDYCPLQLLELLGSGSEDSSGESDRQAEPGFNRKGHGSANSVDALVATESTLGKLSSRPIAGHSHRVLIRIDLRHMDCQPNERLDKRQQRHAPGPPLISLQTRGSFLSYGAIYMIQHCCSILFDHRQVWLPTIIDTKAREYPFPDTGSGSGAELPGETLYQ